MSDLSHTHAQQALVHAFDQPALAYQSVVGLLPVVAVWGSHKRKVRHRHTNRLFIWLCLQVDYVSARCRFHFNLCSNLYIKQTTENIQNSP